MSTNILIFWICRTANYRCLMYQLAEPVFRILSGLFQFLIIKYTALNTTAADVHVCVYFPVNSMVTSDYTFWLFCVPGLMIYYYLLYSVPHQQLPPVPEMTHTKKVSKVNKQPLSHGICIHFTQKTSWLTISYYFIVHDCAYVQMYLNGSLVWKHVKSAICLHLVNCKQFFST